MRRLLFLLCGLTLLIAPASASASGISTGGSSAPSSNGGLTYGQPVQKVRRASRIPFRPIASEFTVAPAALETGHPATIAFRVDGRARKVRVRIDVARAGGPVERLKLGLVRTNRIHQHVWVPDAAELTPGEYDVTLSASDEAGRKLRRTATASGRSRVTITIPPPLPDVLDGVFPIQGTYSFGGTDSVFGAGRTGHIHQGQDMTAAEGTPLVAPVASTVYWIAFQEGGAGHYVVLRDAAGTDYVFMHLKEKATVAKGAVLTAGTPFGQVGNTGSSSGAHLHFEIWPGGWYSSKTSVPIDPLPQLMAWAGTR